MRTHLILGVFGIAAVVVALMLVGLGSASADEASAGRDAAPPAPAATIVVTSTADSGVGTLRQVMLDAVSGDIIGFDTAIFPPSNPQTITLSSVLPNIITGNLTIDGSNAGVVLDGSNIGTGVETQLFDGISLTLDGGPNLLVNGDFDAGMGHWRPWDEWETPTRTLNTLDVQSAPNALQWSGHVRQSWSRTVYDTGNTSEPFLSWPFEPGSSAWISATGGSTVTVNLWYKGGFPSVDLWVLYSDNGTEEIHWDLSQETDWTTATLTHTLPGNAIAVALDLQHYHTEQWSSGLSIHSNNNTIRGLQIVGFPDNGIYLGEGTQGNIIGGDRSVGAGPLGQGNLLSANGSIGVNIYGSNGNTVSGNTIGTDVTESGDLGNRLEGISINEGASNNLIGGDTAGECNLISGNDGPGVWIGGIGTMSNTVSGNTIGADATGTAAIGNEHSGIHIEDGGSYNLIGGDTPSERNLISGNGTGVSMAGSNTLHNTLSGNYIGTDVSGTAAISNAGAGVNIYGGASYNLIGGDTPDERNLISGNSDDGVIIAGSGTMSNTVCGNTIGTDASGTAALGNSYRGVFILDGAQHNTVSNNLISGNGNDGVPIEGNGTMYNTVSGNYIGTNSSGTAAIGNALDGVYVAYGAQHNRITDNLISGNNQNGVQIRASDTMSNTISGNAIGTDASGTAALPNHGNGVEISNGASYNLVGGTTEGERNLISGNRYIGVNLYNNSSNNTVSGNYIGTDVSGTSAIGNAQSGVYIAGATNNLIGGSNASPGAACSGECNLISGNDAFGVYINGGGITSNTIAGNYIGTDASGNTPLSNAYDGVRIDNGAQHNVVGGDTADERNVISGNGGCGVGIYDPGTAYNLVAGNYVGLDVTGAAAVPNAECGVKAVLGASNNALGGTTIGERNVISGNGGHGVVIGGNDSVGNTVTGSYIGTDQTGTTAIPNTWAGVELGGGASYTLVGGDTPGERNVISGNGNNGVSIWGSGTMSNTVSGNYIGTDVSGMTALSNAASGVAITNGASNNLIGGLNATPGGACSGECNLIGTSGGHGVLVGGLSNTVSGNYIGVNVTGSSIIGAGYGGVWIQSAQYTIVGGDTPAERNIIAGSSDTGVALWGVDTTDNTVIGNYIGVDAGGTVALGNGIRNVGIWGGANHNFIGGANPGEGNLISGNSGDGVDIMESGTSDNTVAGNTIGTDFSGSAPLGNGGTGVHIWASASNNLIGGNTPGAGNLISGNDGNGVTISGDDALYNIITRNSIHSNGGRGIELSGGGNTELPAPVIIGFDLAAGTVTGTACASCTIEVFSDDEDEGRVYEGTTTADPGGDWSFTKGSALTGLRVTATATDLQGNTSEFSIVPYIRVNRSHNWVDGLSPMPNAEAEAAVFDSQSNLKGTGSMLSNEDGWFGGINCYDGDGHLVNIGTGDVVSVTIKAGPVITAEVVSMTATPNIATDTVTGSVVGASEGQQVWAEVWDLPTGPGQFKSTVQADGSYSVHVDGLDLRDGHMVAVWYQNDQGNAIGLVRHWLRIETEAEGSIVWGDTMPGASVQITVAGDGIKGTGGATTDEEGHYWIQIYSDTQPITIMPGDTITVTADGRSTTMTVESLTGVMDFYADAICGVAPLDSKVRIEVWGEFGDWGDVDASGHYCIEVDFDLQPGHQGEVAFFDERWHRTRAQLTASERQITALPLGDTLEDEVEPLTYSDYAVEVGAGEHVLVEVVPLSDIEEIWLYGKLGSLPSRAEYDFQTVDATASGTYLLLVSPTCEGTYYFSVFGWDIIGDRGTYTITARTIAGRQLFDVQPHSAGNAGALTLNVQGFGFVEGMEMELRHSSHPDLVADSVMRSSSTALSAHFDLTGAAPGVYDSVAIWPGGAEVVLEESFEILAGGTGARLEASLEAPEFVRPDRTFVLWVDYANTGDMEMVAPLFIVSSPDGVPMRLADAEPFEDGPVQVLGVNPEGLAGNLPPGASGRIPIYFHVPPGTGGHEMLDFDLAIMISDTMPIDWGEVEAEIRPPDVDDKVWDVLWPNLTAQIGDTWGDYRQMLADNASYLSTLDRSVYGARDLFRFEVRKALGMNPRAVLAGGLDAYAPAPGMPLQFGRVFPGSLEGRFYLGPLGRGWSHSYDITLEELSDGDVRLHWPGSFTRLFISDGVGTFVPLPGDYGDLVSAGGIYTLTEKDGSIARFRTDGQWDYLEDPNGNRVTAVYDGSDRLVEIHHSSGMSLTLAYNAHGRISLLTDHAGRVTEYGYDVTGRHLLTVMVPGGRVVTYTYNAATGQPTDHALLSIAYPDSTHQYYDYESLGRLSEEYLDDDAERITYTYDALGRIHITDAGGETTIISPDEHGRPGEVRDGLGNELGQEYDPAFNLSELTDPAGQLYTFDYDLQGNVIAAEDPLGHQVKLGYDTRFGQIASLEDARGNRTMFEYDEAGNLTTVTYPDGSQESFAYDAAGNLTSYTNRSGDTVTYTYNARGQLLRKDYPDGTWVAYTYDAAGNMTTASDPSGAITMTYEADTDYLTSITYPSGHTFEFSYNDAGQRTQRVDQDGHELNYEYDAAGRLSRLYDENGTTIITYSYDAVGRLSQETKGNGTYSVYEYDAAGQVLTITHRAPDDSVQSFFAYTYDANGNRTSMTMLEGTTTYEYDLIGQLTGVTYPDSRHVTYAYDAAGNRVTVTDDGTPTTYTTNNLDQYTQVGAATYAYDDNGNMTSMTDGSGTTTYEYDYDNRLIRVTTPLSGTWEYTYDPLGNRIVVEHDGTVTRYVHDPIGLVDVAAEYDGGGTLVAQYAHGLGLAARVDAAGDPAYYAFDGTGHTRQVTDDTGAVANTYDYTPFGIPLQADETIPNPFRYVGRFGVMEDGSGLQYMRARCYSSALGRFTTSDPIGIAGGVNLYTYVHNNPVSTQDPMGLVEGGWMYWVPELAKGILGGAQQVLDAAGLYGLPFNLEGVGELAELAGRSWGDPFSVSWDEVAVAAQHTLGEVGDLVAFLSYDVPYWWYTRNIDQTGILESLDSMELPSSTTTQITIDTSENLTSEDPNEKVSPAGTGPQHSVGLDDELHYVIYFENVMTATAPAQEVFVTDSLDPDLDWSTFRLTEIAWGDHVVAVPGDAADFHTQQTVADYRVEVGKSWWVDVEAEIDYTSGEVQWTFRTLDPQTGDLPLDPLAGFLPPNDETHRGEGYVAFTIRPRVDSADGTVLTNQASIVFDTNEPIVTNEVTNTIGWPKIYLPVVMCSYGPSSSMHTLSEGVGLVTAQATIGEAPHPTSVEAAHPVWSVPVHQPGNGTRRLGSGAQASSGRCARVERRRSHSPLAAAPRPLSPYTPRSRL